MVYSVLFISYHYFTHCCFLWAVFLLAIKITSKLSNFILHQFGGLHKLWDTPLVKQWVVHIVPQHLLTFY